ncbi:MAG TPA: hypothetical protein VL635_15100 [Trinickia sp.]|nr:hypothetical protein [Trinickia sp.]
MDAIDRKPRRGAAALLIAGCLGFAASAFAQHAATNVGASMVQPPQSPASGVSAHNPDNMPIKRPQQAPRDPIARHPPASATKPK